MTKIDHDMLKMNYALVRTKLALQRTIFISLVSLKAAILYAVTKRYKNIVIIEPYYGSILERKIRRNNFLNIKILSIGYDETIVHKYGTKLIQDKYLKFNKENILKRINEFK